MTWHEYLQAIENYLGRATTARERASLEQSYDEGIEITEAIGLMEDD